MIALKKAAEDAFGYDKDETIGENITMLMADQKHVVNHHSYLKQYGPTHT
jgi:hypothetical protein